MKISAAVSVPIAYLAFYIRMQLDITGLSRKGLVVSYGIPFAVAFGAALAFYTLLEKLRGGDDKFSYLDELE